MQCGMSDTHENYLRIDYSFMPRRAFLYQNKTLVKKWSEKEPIKLIHKLIDGMECSGFEKLKIKTTLDTVLKVFEPKNIKVVSHE